MGDEDLKDLFNPIIWRITGDPYNWWFAAGALNTWRGVRGYACWSIAPTLAEVLDVCQSAKLTVKPPYGKCKKVDVDPVDILYGKGVPDTTFDGGGGAESARRLRASRSTWR